MCLTCCWVQPVKLIRGFISNCSLFRARLCTTTKKSILEIYICLGYTPDGIVLVGGYYVTCLDLSGLVVLETVKDGSIFRRKVADHAH